MRAMRAARQASLQEGGGGARRHGARSPTTRAAPVKGKLDFAENRIDQATGTMRVRARFANPDLRAAAGPVRPRQRAGLAAAITGILVPDEAIGADQDRRIVYVVDDARHGVGQAGPARPALYGYRVIREGLTGDETIVVNGLMRVGPGVKVKPELVTLPPEARPPAGRRNEVCPFLRRPADLRDGAVDRLC